LDPPNERAARLQKLAEEVPKMDPARKGQTAAELTQMLKNEPDPVLRVDILRTLDLCGGPAADAMLRCALRGPDPDADVRSVACGLVGKHGGADTVKLLSDVLAGDIDKDVRMAAVRALGWTHDRTAVAAVAPALDDKDPAMQYCAVLALRKLTDRDLGNDVDRWRAAIRDGSLQRGDPPTLTERFHHWF
jgi:HEAT repeat protein